MFNVYTFNNVFLIQIIIKKIKMTSDKCFSALLNGLTRLHYYHDDSITETFLKHELYNDMPDNDFILISQKCVHIIKVILNLFRLFICAFLPFSDITPPMTVFICNVGTLIL